MIAVVDFGSQTAHLITRRLKDAGIEAELVDPTDVLTFVSDNSVAGLIFSGGPASVYEKDALSIDSKVFTLGLPILGICYGWQLTAKLLGGEVQSGKKEYGPTQLNLKKSGLLLKGLPKHSTVWESHGDTVFKLPQGFEIIGQTQAVVHAAVMNTQNKIWGVQFHPEISHTEHGKSLLINFATLICQLPLRPKQFDVESMLESIRQTVGDRLVVGAISGGTDSTVAGMLVAKSIGKQFLPVYAHSGLMRVGTLERIKKLEKEFGVPIEVIDASQAFLDALKGVTDPEAKRKTIGALYIKLFNDYAADKKVQVLLQGTTYADFIHSQGSKRSAHIKSHHNVGGLPKDLKFELLEPLRYLYTDQVRALGLQLGIPKNLVFQQPFPGPGHAVRVLGEVTKERLDNQIKADAIVIEEMKKSGWYDKVFQCWSIMTGTKSTAVKGDSRAYGEVVALRVVTTEDRMSADWAKLPYDLLQSISSRIVNEVPDVSRVVYDITTKPPATMEWE